MHPSAAVVAALAAHGEANAEVAWQGLWAIQNLAAPGSDDASYMLLSDGIGTTAGAHSAEARLSNQYFNLGVHLSFLNFYIFWLFVFALLT